MRRPGRADLAAWARVAVVTVVASTALSLLRVPSAVLFGALLGGMAHGLGQRPHLRVSPTLFRVGQAVIGVTIGSLVSLAALRRVAADPVPILLVTLGTLGLSLGAGLLLARCRDVSAVTGTFALVAGGASGVVAVARDLGADDRVVTVVQYLRVLAVLLAMPLVTLIVFRPEHGQGTVDVATTGWTKGLLFVVVSTAGGLVLARVAPLPTATLLGPLFVAALLSAGAGWGPVSVPSAVQWFGYLVIGVQVGLRFTRASLASIARMLPVVVLLIAGLIAACAGMGVLLAATGSVSPLTAYLATTPGGMYAVLAIAADAGSDTTYVMAVQLFRLLVVLLLTPYLARWLGRRAA